MLVSEDSRAPLIAHVIYRLDVGGLENGLVNLVNRLDPNEFRHAIVCLTDASDFRQRIRNKSVAVLELHKKPGKDIPLYWRFWKALRSLKPDIVHTRNVNALEFQLLAWLARTRLRVHGEHGWDVHDLDGTSLRYRRWRRLFQHFVDRFVVVSSDLQRYLTENVGIASDRVELIRNGVDTSRFRPARKANTMIETRRGSEHVVTIGSVGRLKDVKNFASLIDAIHILLTKKPELRKIVRFLLVGDGTLRPQLLLQVEKLNLTGITEMPGATSDVPSALREMDIFVCSSSNEGISNTILEAMATGLPVVATNVGGNPELVANGQNGQLVEADTPEDMAAALGRYVSDEGMRKGHGQNGRRRAEEEFAMEKMVNAYRSVYTSGLATQVGRPSAI
jgi:sugar transferase (PEP-CTERM/EpsH1 system associated)